MGLVFSIIFIIYRLQIDDKIGINKNRFLFYSNRRLISLVCMVHLYNAVYVYYLVSSEYHHIVASLPRTHGIYNYDKDKNGQTEFRRFFFFSL